MIESELGKELKGRDTEAKKSEAGRLHECSWIYESEPGKELMNDET